MSRHPITATPARPPRYSFVSVVETLTGLDEIVFGAGWTTNPENCGGASGGVVKIECFGTQDAMTAGENAEFVGDDPFVVWAADECSTLGSARRDWEGRATRALLATQSYHIASEFATGNGRDNDGPTFADAASVSTGSSPVQSLAFLEDEVSSSLRGERAMLHMPFSLLTVLVAEGAVRRDGTIWVTPSDNVVVADAGYAEAMDAGTIVATSMVGLGLSPIELNPGSFDQAVARSQMIDRSINLVTLYAQRNVVFVWDQCLLAQVAVPGYGGGG